MLIALRMKLLNLLMIDIESCMVFLIHKVLFFKILDKSELLLEAWIYQYVSTMVASCLEYCLEYVLTHIITQVRGSL